MRAGIGGGGVLGGGTAIRRIVAETSDIKGACAEGWGLMEVAAAAGGGVAWAGGDAACWGGGDSASCWIGAHGGTPGV
jgi:hypothetical protein